MKLSLSLPCFHPNVTVADLEAQTVLAEQYDFDSVWTQERVMVPESSDRGELRDPFGRLEGFPKALPVPSRGRWAQAAPVLPWLAAKTSKVRLGQSIIVTAFRPPVRVAADMATLDQLCGGRLNVGLGAGWLHEEFQACGAAEVFAKKNKHVIETIEVCQGIWTNEIFEYHGEFVDFEPAGFGWKPVQKPHPPIYFSGLTEFKRSAKRIAKYNLGGWIGIADGPEDIVKWRREINQELGELGTELSPDFVMTNMLWFAITEEKTDQTPAGKATPWMVGDAQQIEDMLKRYAEAGLTMPMLWTPFEVAPSKTCDDLKRLAEEIMPKVNAM